MLHGEKADRRENLRWQREREHQRELWAREDSRRTFDQKREVYVDFHQQLRVASLAIFDLLYKQGPPLGDGWQLPLYESLLRVRIFGSREVSIAASHAYQTSFDWGGTQPHEATEIVGVLSSPGEEEQEAAIEAYLEAMRHDLGIEMPTPVALQAESRG